MKTLFKDESELDFSDTGNLPTPTRNTRDKNRKCHAILTGSVLVFPSMVVH
jgi:hypothetical protein